MKKKLVLLCMMLCSIFGFLACNDIPYANMKLTLYYEGQELKEGTAISLNIAQKADKSYEYGEAVVSVKVSDDDSDTDRSITYSGHEGYLSVVSKYNEISGVTTLNLKALSVDRSGPINITIATKEGNKTCVLRVNIEVLLESFSFKEDKLNVIGKGQSISLSDINDFLKFEPYNTTQKNNVEISIADFVPIDEESDYYYVDGWQEGGEYYFERIDEVPQKYAEITSDKTLITRVSYGDVTNKIKYAYPTITTEVDRDTGVNIQQEYIVLKASFEDPSRPNGRFVQFVKIKVVEKCDKIDLMMRSELKPDEMVEIPKNSSGTYDIVLFDPSLGSGSSISQFDYCIKRYLYLNLLNDKSEIDDNYVLSNTAPKDVSKSATSTPDCVEIHTDPINNQITVESKAKGECSKEFKIVHRNSEYSELFEQTIVINFIVKDFPTSITINGKDKGDNHFVVYDNYYPAQTLGTPLNIKLNNTIGQNNFYLLVTDFVDFDNLHVMTSQGLEEVVLAKGEKNPDGSLVNISSSVEGKDFPYFPSNSTIYVKHSFSSIPEDLTLYVSVSMSLVPDSYVSINSGLTMDYFKEHFGTEYSILFPIYLKFEKDIGRFEFTQDEYHLDLANKNNCTDVNSSDSLELAEGGVKLLTLPVGQSLASVIKELEYDKSLIKVYEKIEYLEEEDVNVSCLYVKCNNTLREGSTTLRIVAKNGLIATRKISTFMPSFYSGDSAESKVPMAITVDTGSSGYLYHITGSNTIGDYSNHKTPFDINLDGVNYGNYESVNKLFVFVGGSVKLNFYDILLSANADGTTGTKQLINVNNKVSISLSDTGMATYSNGQLYVYRVTADKEKPLRMVVTYYISYETMGEDGSMVFVGNKEYNHIIDVYIYEPLGNVSIQSEKSKSLYISDTLSYFDKDDKSSNTIRTNYKELIGSLGGAWNDGGIFGEWQPISLSFDFGMLSMPIADKNNNPIIISELGDEYRHAYNLTYGDLFKQIKNADNTYTVRAELSENLKKWISDYYKGNADLDEAITRFLTNYVYGKDYKVVINAHINQFDKLHNLNSVVYTCCYSPKIQNLTLNVDNDGIYFDIRRLPDKYEIEYTIDNSDVLNKEMIILNDSNAVFNTTIVSSTGRSGIITITPNRSNVKTGGIYYLTIIPKDNVSNITEEGVYECFNDKLNQIIRVKVADGSESSPFEIKNVDDYKTMIDDLSATRYYRYVLARDISLRDLEDKYIGVDILDTDKGIFSLSGKHEYYRNGAKVVTYSKIFDLKINRTVYIDGRMNTSTFGLFGNLGSAVSISHLNISNASIRISYQNAIDSYNSYVGILAGITDGTKIVSSVVNGDIRIDGLKDFGLRIGGLVGKASNTVISGNPGNLIAGLANTKNNAYVSIIVNDSISSKDVSQLYIGGQVGELIESQIVDQCVVSSIRISGDIQSSSIGGVIGYATTSTLNNVESSPVIDYVGGSQSKLANIGGLVGTLNANSQVNLSRVVFANIGDEFTASDKINIYVIAGIANVGGLAGNATDAIINGSYVRSYYSIAQEDNVYLGNMLVKANDTASSIGGLFGYAKANITESYFDGDIAIGAIKGLDDTYTAPHTGAIAGKLESANIVDSFGMLDVRLIVEDKLFTLDDARFNLSDIAIGLSGNLNLSESNLMFAGLHVDKYTLQSVSFNNAYAVIDKKVNDLGLTSGNTSYIYRYNGDIAEALQSIMLNRFIFYKIMGYSITDGQKDGDHTASDYTWFVHNDVNGGYPVLLRDGKSTYELLPTNIDIIIRDENDHINGLKGIIDISYDGMSGKENQLIMTLNKNAYGITDDTFYEIATIRDGVDNSKVAIVVKYNGTIVQTALVTIPINDSLEIITTTANDVIKLVGNRIYPNNEGVATIQVRSSLDRSVKADIRIVVLAGITGVEIYENTLNADNTYSLNKIADTLSVYLDEQSNFTLKPVNMDRNYHEYKSTEYVGYILETLPTYDSKSNLVEGGSITFEDKIIKYEQGANNIYYINNPQGVALVGSKLGELRMKITPYYILPDTHYVGTYNSIETPDGIYVLDNSKSLVIQSKVLARAIAVDHSTKEASISASNVFPVNIMVETSNVLQKVLDSGEIEYTVLEDIFFSLNNRNTDNLRELLKHRIELDTIVVDSANKEVVKHLSTPIIYEYDLITIRLKGYSLEKTNSLDINRLNTYKISLDVEVEFNKDFYRTNASKYDLNNAKFYLTTIPESNVHIVKDTDDNNVATKVYNNGIKDTTIVSIAPAVLTDIFTNFYSRGEAKLGGLSNVNSYPYDNESIFIIPGREGLLKITLNEEYNNVSYVTVTLDKKYADYVELKQMSLQVSSLYENSGDSDEAICSEVTYFEIVETASTYGIKLQKLSANFGDNTLFNNTYYLRLKLNKNYEGLGLQNVTLAINSYTLQEDHFVETIPAKVVSLTIAELPKVVVEVDNSVTVNLGYGVKKPLEIKYSGVSDSDIIDFTISSDNDNASDYLRIVDDNGVVVSTLNVGYLMNGGKYYVSLAVECSTQNFDNFRVRFICQKEMWGVVESTVSELTIYPVNFEIDDLTIDNTTKQNGETILTLTHGQSMIIRLNVEYKKITESNDILGRETSIKEYEKLLNTYFDGEKVLEFGNKQKFEYALAGTSVVNTTTQDTVVENKLELSRIWYEGSELKIEKMLAFGQIYGGVKLDTRTIFVNEYEYEYTYIKGVSISDYTRLRLYYPYCYESGMIVAGKTAGQTTYYEKYIDFRVIVNDSSTDTHPTPIENQEDLIRVANTKGHYVLVNNIKLTNWAPIDISVDSLDGNGYSFIIESFNFSQLRGGDTANAGIFGTVSSGTLLKNITIDVSNILISDVDMQNNVNYANQSRFDSYTTNETTYIDLTFITNVNFGLLAGVNNGAITNAKVVNTKDFNSKTQDNAYLLVLTTIADASDKTTTSRIGCLVGQNTSSGVISNSYIGLNVSNIKNNISYMTGVSSPDATAYNNANDVIKNDIILYPFILAGLGNVGGMVAENNGIVSNSYAKGLGVYNTNAIVDIDSSATAGLVAKNLGKITSAFVEGDKISGYRAEKSIAFLESKGVIGGLVCNNTGIIENAYANIYIENRSSFIGGFVFKNDTSGIIKNSYSTSVNLNSQARGQFTGVNAGKLQNFGLYENCYYLVLIGEAVSEIEAAIAIKTEYIEKGSEPIETYFSGFSFVTTGGNIEDGIWTLDGGLPKIVTTLQDTTSFRRLEDTIEEEDGDVITEYYNYAFDADYGEGTAINPLIIDKAENFDKYIIGRSVTVDNIRIFGNVTANDAILDRRSNIEYVRLVNNLDFTNIVTANKYDGTYLYETIFAGKLDGNGLAMQNLHIVTDTTQLENFGLFRQIGTSETHSVIKNVDIKVASYKSSESDKAGILAGTIINASIVNVNIDGGNTIISASHMAGALAGVITAGQNKIDGIVDKVSIIGVSASNIIVEATYSSLGGELDGYSVDHTTTGSLDSAIYKSFSINDKETGDRLENKKFTSLYNNGTDLSLTSKVSYAGIIAGVINANNDNKVVQKQTEFADNINYYRSDRKSYGIENILVSGAFTIRNGDNVGGLFGYVGENTRIKDSKVELSDNVQLLKGFNYIGGAVGENHGILEGITIAYNDATQSELDMTLDPAVGARNSGKDTLFRMEGEGQNFYNTVVGGLVGYSSNGVIIDSYNKANVSQPYAYIVGGILGYSEAYNYLGYSYNLGAVYGRDIIGGIVGFEVTKNNEEIDLDTVISITNWNVYRDSISKSLYDNYKSLYVSSTIDGYDNFYLKMPEIGNLVPSSIETIASEEELQNTYLNAHTNMFIGSAVGKVVLTNGDALDTDTSSPRYYSKNNSNYYITSISNGNNYRNVLSNTYGIHTVARGEYANTSGRRTDTYFATSYSLDAGLENPVTQYSYRTANKSTLNEYSDSIGYKDYIVFKGGFGGQEYSEQLVGKFYKEGTRTANAYLCYDESDRYNLSSTNYTFESHNAINGSSRWVVKNNVAEKNLGTYSSVVYIYAGDEGAGDKLIAALTSGEKDKTYILRPGKVDDATNTTNTITISITKDSAVFADTAVGSIIKCDSSEPVKVVFNVEGSVNTLFNAFSNAQLQNLDLVINVSSTDWTKSKDSDGFGIFANSIKNVTIDNCSIAIDIANFVTNTGDTSIFMPTSVGVMFGKIENSNITNSKLVVNASSISITKPKISKFGIISGSIRNSVFANNTITLPESIDLSVGFTLDSSGAREISVGGLFGDMFSSSYYSNNLVNSSIVSLEDMVNCEKISIQNQDGSTTTLSNNITKNYSALIGSATNSSIYDLETKTIKLDYTLAVNYNNSTINIAGIIAKANNCKLYGLKINKTENSVENLISVTTTDVENLVDTMNIGAFVGYNESDLFVGRLEEKYYNSIEENIEAVVYANNLNVGVLVGKSKGTLKVYNTYVFANLEAVNKRIGTKSTTYDERGNEKTTYQYVTNNLGGMMGYAYGKVSLSGVLTSGIIALSGDNLNITDLYAETVSNNLGGVIGLTNNICELSNFEILNDLKLDRFVLGSGNTMKNTYLSGVIGLNKGTFTASNGYAYAEATKVYSGVLTCPITNNKVNNLQDVYFASEFIGNNAYEASSKFGTFAMADLVDAISPYSSIYALVEDNAVLTTVGKVVLPNASGIDNKIKSKLANVLDLSKNSRFNPNKLTGSNSFEKYNVILSDIDAWALTSSLSEGSYISGRNVLSGKVKVRLNLESNIDRVYLIPENNGVISNIYFNTAIGEDEIDGVLDVVLTKNNYGTIINTLVYGKTKANVSIAEINYGMICRTGSSVIYDELETGYGLVLLNIGEIRDCYSSNAGISANINFKTNIYGLLAKNSIYTYDVGGTIYYADSKKINYYSDILLQNQVGAISPGDQDRVENKVGSVYNSICYIPELLLFNNVYKSICLTNGGNMSSCYKSQIENTILNRDAVWTTENGHMQLKGFKDIPGSIVMHIEVKSTSKGYVDLSSDDLKISQTEVMNYKYVIKAFESEQYKYNVVRIMSGADLINYINSLSNNNYTVPSGTVIAIMQDIKIDGSRLKAFSLSKDSFLIGITHVIGSGDSSVERSFVTLTFDKNAIKSDELILRNEGVISGLEIAGLNIRVTRKYTYFGLINYNSGIISNLKIGSVTQGVGTSTSASIIISAINSQYVSSLVVRNDGHVNYVYIQSANLSAVSGYYEYVIEGGSDATINNCAYRAIIFAKA